MQSNYSGSQRDLAIRALQKFGVPKLAYLGVNKDTIARVSMRREAHWKCQFQKYFSVNIDFSARRKRRSVVIDIDDRFDDNSWLTIVDLINDGIIPAPAFAFTRIKTINGEARKTRAHMVYPLEFPIDEGNPQQKCFMEAVLDEFYDILKAHGVPVDKKQGVTLKNPAAEEWDVTYFNDNTHSLKDWAELFEISDLTKEEQKKRNRARRSEKRARKAAEKAGINGTRNQDVFDEARHRCYARKYQHIFYSSFFEEVSEIVRKVHDEKGYGGRGLSFVELNHIAKSIAKWTWDNYEGEGYDPRNRGACASYISMDMDTAEKQRIGAGYSHDKRAEAVIQKIRDGVNALTEAGEKITVRSLAVASGVAASTVQKYRKVAEGVEEYSPKAQKFAAVIKENLARISTLAQENLQFSNLYCDGVSETPRRDLPLAAEKFGNPNNGWNPNKRGSGTLKLRKVASNRDGYSAQPLLTAKEKPAIRWDLLPVTLSLEHIMDDCVINTLVEEGHVAEEEVQRFKDMLLDDDTQFIKLNKDTDWYHSLSGIRVHRSMVSCEAQVGNL